MLAPGLYLAMGMDRLLNSSFVMRRLLDIPSRPLVAAILAAALLPACTGSPGAPPPGFSNAEAPQALGRTYRLGIGDKLKVTVFGEENLSGPVEVNAMGQVALPLAGEIPAKGLTLSEFRDGVARKLSNGFLKQPRVTVEMITFRPIYVHGEVRSGGEFQYKTGVKIRDVIAMAGGYTYRADQSFAYVVREGEQEVRLPLPSDTPVLPGDNIRIPERFF